MKNQIDIFSIGPRGTARDFFGFTPILGEMFEDLTPENRKVRSSAVLTPACDVEETPHHYLISLDMPGIAKEDIKIEVAQDQLIVSAERHKHSDKKHGALFLNERSAGRFFRTFTLDAQVEPEKVEAVYRDGVLNIAVPKAEVEKPKKISVRSEDSSGLFGKLLSFRKNDSQDSLN